MFKSRKASISYVLLLSFAVFLLIWLKSYAHQTHYCTPDSDAYLGPARLILGSNFEVLKGSFTIWPIGYPVLIAVVSKLTSLSLLWSSKLLNFLFFGGILLIVQSWLKEKSSFVSLSLLTYGTLEILAFTWSETMFLFFVMLFVKTIYELKSESPKLLNSSLFFVALCGLFLTKYTSAIFFVFALVFLIGLIVKDGLKKYLIPTGLFLFASIILIVYLVHNYSIDGYLTGEPRFFSSSVHLSGTLKAIFYGLINELFLARKLYVLRLDWFFIVFLFFQALLLIFLFYKKPKAVKINLFNGTELLLLVLGAFYIVAMVLLRLFIPLYDFDYRLLSPSSLLILTSLLSFYSRQEVWFKATKNYVVAFFVLIYLFSFPKEYILTQLEFM